MDIAKEKAAEFLAMAIKDGWQQAIDTFNESYAPADANDILASKPFELTTQSELQRISKELIETIAQQNLGNPGIQNLINSSSTEKSLREAICNLLPADGNSVENVAEPLEFKPNMSYYCIKNIATKRLTEQDFEGIKAIYAYTQDMKQVQSLAAVHFNPKNIEKRMRFEQVKEDEDKKEDQADVNTPAEDKVQ